MHRIGLVYKPDLLFDQAIAHLQEHGGEADLLRAIANYVTERDR